MKILVTIIALLLLLMLALTYVLYSMAFGVRRKRKQKSKTLYNINEEKTALLKKITDDLSNSEYEQIYIRYDPWGKILSPRRQYAFAYKLPRIQEQGMV